MDLRKGLRFLRVYCLNEKEARARALCLALLTYSLSKNNFVKFYTFQEIKAGFFINSLKGQWESFGIDLRELNLLLSGTVR